MKVFRANQPDRAGAGRGFVVVVMMVILAILCILVVANTKRLHALGRELKIVERHQVQRLQPESRATNRVDAVHITQPSLANEPH